MQMPASLKVLISRDRREAGGGIFGFFEAITPYLDVEWRLCDVGRRHAFYQPGGKADGRVVSNLRVIADWLCLGFEILRFRPALVHLNAGLDKEERSLWREAVSVRIARTLGCRVLVFWHGWDHPAAGTAEFPGGNGGWLARSYRMAAAHVVLANVFRVDLQRWGFEGVHLGSTVVSEEVLQVVAEPVRCGGTPMLLFLSRIEKAKGLWELLDSYAELKKRKISCELTIAGDGPDLAALKERATELEITDITFPGYVSGEGKSECFRRATIFCFPSYSEGMPLAVLEAMAMGLPVVASAVGGLADILEDGKTGYLLKPNMSAPVGQRINVEELADRLATLLADSVLRQGMGEVNVREARERFTPAKVAKEMDAIYLMTV